MKNDTSFSRLRRVFLNQIAVVVPMKISIIHHQFHIFAKEFHLTGPLYRSLSSDSMGGKMNGKRKREATSQLERVSEHTSKRMSSQNERKTTFNQGHLFDKEQCLESIHTHFTHTVPVWMSIPFRLSLPTIFYINEATTTTTATSSTCTRNSLVLGGSVSVCMCVRVNIISNLWRVIPILRFSFEFLVFILLFVVSFFST